jgi:bis(5'-nucleosyl)-tetraphosphatase (symmetrical)
MAYPTPSRHRRRRRAIFFLLLLFCLCSLYFYTQLFTSMPLSAQSFQPKNYPDDDVLEPLNPPEQPESPEDAVDDAEKPVGRKAKAITDVEAQKRLESQADLPMEYGTNARPEFKDLVQLGSVASKHIPSRDNHKRLIIVGDVHGMLGSLEALLKKVGFDDGKNDHLILAGDMISKGPDSPGVIDLAMRVGASAVRGNHEDRVLLANAGMKTNRVADAVDGTGSNGDDPDVDTLEQEVFSHGDYMDRNTARGLTKTQLQWLADLPVVLDVGTVEGFGNIVVVHAGLVPGVPLEQQDPWAVMNMRTIVYPRQELRMKEAKEAIQRQVRQRVERAGRGSASFVGIPPQKLVDKEYQKRKKKEDREVIVPIDGRGGERWTDVWNAHQGKLADGHAHTTVVFGHDAKNGLHVDKYTFGLDSGCVHGGRLTALVIEGTASGIKHQLVHVDCVATAGT